MTFKLFFNIAFLFSTLAVYAQSPKVDSFSPASGPINTSVIISGSGFSTTPTNNIVYFGAVRGQVLSATAAQLNVNAPAGASFEPLSVTVNGLTGYASKPFFITFPGAEPLSDQSFKPYLNFDISPESFVVTDLDRDGTADLALSGNSLSLAKNTTASATFGPQSLSEEVIVTGSLPSDKILVADFDGDGAKDLLQSPDGASNLLVFRNLDTQGVITSASFGAGIALPLLYPTNDLSYGDFDGDGRIDIVAITTDVTNYSITFFQNTSSPGSISFAARMDIPSPDGLLSMGVGDLDGDGHPDLLITNYARSVNIYRNKLTGPGPITAGSFDAPFILLSNDYAFYITVSDLDSDGKNDIALLSSQLELYHNVGTPGVLNAASFDAPVVPAASGPFALGDLNGDGRPDLAVSDNTNSISIMLNASAPGTLTSTSFSEPVTFSAGYRYHGLFPTLLRINDLDNDGKSEVIILNSGTPSVSVLRNTFGPAPAVPQISSFTPASAPPGGSVTISGNNFSAVSADNVVFFGATAGIVTAASNTELKATVPLGATADYISVTTHARTAISPKRFLPMHTGTKTDVTFLPPFELSTDVQSDFVSLKDLDNDGRTDLIVRNKQGRFNGNATIFKNIGQDTTIAFDNGYIVANAGYNYTISDVDGDGRPDLVGMGPDEGDGGLLVVHSSDGDFADIDAHKTIADEGQPDPGNLAVADLDGDGQPDLGVAEDDNAGLIGIYRSVNGGFPQDGVQNLGVDPNAGFITFGDIDGDGKPDAIVSQPEGGTVSVLQNTSVPGTITFSAPVTFATEATPEMVAVADFDSDGRLDIISVNAGSVSILRNTMTAAGVISTGAFAAHFELPGSTPVWVATGDVDGDGKMDIGVVNQGDNTISIFKNISTPGSLNPGSFAGRVSIATGALPSSLAFGDLNNDGATDMAVTQSDARTIVVFLNSNGGATTEGSLIVYNGVSPDGNGKNDHWQIQNINTLPDTKENHVTIYNRWGDPVYDADNYDNAGVVFIGRNNSGKELPNGVYFYKISFTSGRKNLTGYLSLKK